MGYPSHPLPCNKQQSSIQGETGICEQLNVIGRKEIKEIKEIRSLSSHSPLLTF